MRPGKERLRWSWTDSIAVAWILKRTAFKGALEPLLLELPDYKLPSPANLYHGLVTRAGFNQGFALAHLPVRGTRR